jgi:hypothetical protein
LPRGGIRQINHLGQASYTEYAWQKALMAVYSEERETPMLSLNEYAKRQIEHSLGISAAAVAILVVAFALSVVEDYFNSTNRDTWLCLGVKIISIALFSIDAIVVVATSAILSWRLVREMLKDNEP